MLTLNTDIVVENIEMLDILPLIHTLMIAMGVNYYDLHEEDLDAEDTQELLRSFLTIQSMGEAELAVMRAFTTARQAFEEYNNSSSCGDGWAIDLRMWLYRDHM